MTTLVRAATLLALLTFSALAHAQKNKGSGAIDSLVNLIATSKSDTQKLRLTLDLAQRYEVKNPEKALVLVNDRLVAQGLDGEHALWPTYCMVKAIAYYNLKNKAEAKEWALKTLQAKKQNQQLNIKAHRFIGLILEGEGKPTEAIAEYRKMAAIAAQIPDSTQLEAAHYVTAIVLEEMGLYAEALEVTFRSLRILEKLNRNKVVANRLQRIADLFNVQGDHRSALAYYQKALVMFEKSQQKQDMCDVLNNLATSYYALGMLDSSAQCYIKSMNLAAELGDSEGEALCQNNLGLLSFNQGKIAQAKDYFNKALAFQRGDGASVYLANTLESLGELYLAEKNYTEARKLLNEALSIYSEEQDISGLRETHWALARLDSATGNWQQAFLHQTKFMAYRDSLNNEENTRKTIQAQMFYEFERKEDQIKAEQWAKDLEAQKDLHRQKLVRNAFMAGFAVMLLFAGVFLIQRNKIGREKARSEQLLLNILPSEVAEELKAKGEAEARLIEHVTVLFTDFKGFTQLSEQLSPKELVNDLNDCFTAFDHICEKHGIEKIKTIGDAYMAAGGLPTPCADHAQRVVRAALEMREFIANRVTSDQRPVTSENSGEAKGDNERQSEQRTANGEQPSGSSLVTRHSSLQIRIGIHTGPVVAGIVGVKKFQYDIWGDTVNTASRMESSGEVGKVNISEATYALVKDEFACEYRGEVEAKGKGRMGMWFVTGKTT